MCRCWDPRLMQLLWSGFNNTMMVKWSKILPKYPEWPAFSISRFSFFPDGASILLNGNAANHRGGGKQPPGFFESEAKGLIKTVPDNQFNLYLRNADTDFISKVEHRYTHLLWSIHQSFLLCVTLLPVTVLLANFMLLYRNVFIGPGVLFEDEEGAKGGELYCSSEHLV